MLKIGLWGNFLLHRTFSFSLRCYLYHLPDMWRKICHVEKFQISMRDKCEEIWNFSICGVISNFAIWKMWRNLKFLHIWHVCDVENVSTCVKFMSFVVKLVLSQFTHFCRKSVLSRFTCFCVEKKINKTLPEAQRTQGIESITWEIFISQNYLKLISVKTRRHYLHWF